MLLLYKDLAFVCCDQYLDLLSFEGGSNAKL